uniref:Uncharacterized protein n=1 Tax=Aegilops tauschii subsp. strangulata TaxID=200361 RepID=A0A453N766_AEGTS
MQHHSSSNELGEKYKCAERLGIKIVNHRWLEDWYHTTAFVYNISSHIKYHYIADFSFIFILQLKVMENPTRR